MNNKYYKCSKISEAKFRQLVRYFAMDFTASDAAELTGLSRRSVTDIYGRLRQKIAVWLTTQAPLEGTIAVDESYFGPKRIPGKRGRGAGGKTIVFGIFKRQGKVYTEIVPDARKKTLQRVIRGKVEPQSIIHSDGWRGYDGLVDVGYDKHYRVEHGDDEFANSASHINGIESFWSFAKRRLSQFNGVPKHTFYLHLKETEFRFNHRNNNLYNVLLKKLRDDGIATGCNPRVPPWRRRTGPVECHFVALRSSEDSTRAGGCASNGQKALPYSFSYFFFITTFLDSFTL